MDSKNRNVTLRDNIEATVQSNTSSKNSLYNIQLKPFYTYAGEKCYVEIKTILFSCPINVINIFHLKHETV